MEMINAAMQAGALCFIVALMLGQLNPGKWKVKGSTKHNNYLSRLRILEVFGFLSLVVTAIGIIQALMA